MRIFLMTWSYVYNVPSEKKAGYKSVIINLLWMTYIIDIERERQDIHKVSKL